MENKELTEQLLAYTKEYALLSNRMQFLEARIKTLSFQLGLKDLETTTRSRSNTGIIKEEQPLQSFADHLPTSKLAKPPDGYKSEATNPQQSNENFVKLTVLGDMPELVTPSMLISPEGLTKPQKSAESASSSNAKTVVTKEVPKEQNLSPKSKEVIIPGEDKTLKAQPIRFAELVQSLLIPKNYPGIITIPMKPQVVVYQGANPEVVAELYFNGLIKFIYPGEQLEEISRLPQRIQMKASFLKESWKTDIVIQCISVFPFGTEDGADSTTRHDSYSLVIIKRRKKVKTYEGCITEVQNQKLKHLLRGKAFYKTQAQQWVNVLRRLQNLSHGPWKVDVYTKTLTLVTLDTSTQTMSSEDKGKVHKLIRRILAGDVNAPEATKEKIKSLSRKEHQAKAAKKKAKEVN